MFLCSVALLTLIVPMKAVRLRTEYLVDPLALQTPHPRFSWELQDDRYGARQSAYQITVKRDGVVVWDTGKVQSSDQNQIAYAGQALASGQSCEWALRVWDASGDESEWTKATFRTGLMRSSDWLGDWITTPEKTPDILTPNNGHHSVLETTPDKPKWAMFDLGMTRAFDRVRLWPSRPYDWNRDQPGFMFPLRFKIEVSDTPDFQTPHLLVDQTGSDYPNPSDRPAEFTTHGGTGRYLRLMVTKLTERDAGHFGWSLAEFEVVNGEENYAKGATVTVSDGLKDRSWAPDRMVDGERISHGLKGLDALPVTQLRKEFHTRKVKSATFYATALGAYEAYLNGQRVGDHILAPEWTDYHTRVQYQAYDVTKLVREGDNAIGVFLGDGWYAGRIGMAQGLDPRGYPRAVYGRRAWFIGQLELVYEDGSKETVVTDDSWRSTTSGAVRTSDIYDGETYDFSKETAGWLASGYRDGDWERALTSDETPGGHNPAVVAQTNEPIRVVEKLTPLSVTEPKPGVFVFDMGQNMVGWCSLRGSVPEKGNVTLRYVEMLNEDGTGYTENLRGAPQRDVLTFGGSATPGSKFEWRPKFTYHGFRYVEVTGLDKKPMVKDLTGEVFCSSSPEVSHFECSDPMVNRLWANIFWTQRANLMSSPTDCPQRDERLGWMGDILAFAQNGYYNMDLAGFFTKWLPDVRDAQADDGRYPDFAPHPYGKNDRFTGVPGWGDAGVVCAWVHYQNTGDRRLLDEHFDSMKRWVGWIASKNPDFVWRNERHNDYGDWLNGNTLVRQGWDNTGGEMPKDAFATVMWYQSQAMVGKMARVLGKKDEAEKAEDSARLIAAAFNKAFVSPDGEIQGDTQAGYALALYTGILPIEVQDKAFAKLVAAIDKRGGVLTTGFHSTLPMMKVLTERGRNDLAYKLLLNKEFPSWGYTIENGATTIWERWDGFVKGRGFQDPGMNSFNHWALGSVGQWIMETVIGVTHESPGYERIRIAPKPGPGLEWAKADYRTPRGIVHVSWKKEKGGLRLQFTVPANTVATVDLPMPLGKGKAVKGQGHFAADKDGRIEAKAGQYEFFWPAT